MESYAQGATTAPTHPSPWLGAPTPATPPAHDELHAVLVAAVTAVNAYAGKRVDEATVRGVLGRVVEEH